MIEQSLETPFEGVALRGGVVGDGPCRVLMLHGAGQSHRGKLRPFRDELAERGFTTYAFDFVGHGETGGELLGSSLKSRLSQARAFIEFHGIGEKPFSVIAASMGAHTGVLLTKKYAPRALVLIVPAMYATEAFDVPFGPEFSAILRKPQSYLDSHGWDLLAAYRGRVLVVAGENDQVIPPEVVTLFHSSPRNAESSKLVVAKDAGHMLFTELREKDPSRLKEIVDRVAAIL